ncbi:MAG TPA: hypothetical protein VGR88_03850, partial [Ktedonobacterales bacterium]|nr:hypothetical protein [Ktedonobacterales bacterium]
TSVLTNAEGVPVGPTLVGIADDGDLLISALDALYRLSAASNAWQSLGTPPHAYLTYCSAPGSGLLWAVPSGQTGTGQQNVVYTASYAP